MIPKIQIKKIFFFETLNLKKSVPKIFYHDTHKIIKRNIFVFVHSINMAEEYIMLFENDDKSYTMVDQYINHRYLKYVDSYNYFVVDVDKMLLLKISDNEYIIRYSNVNKMMIIPLQLEINNSYNEINILAKNNRVMFIYNCDKESFRKCIEILDKIIELMGINNHTYFLKVDGDDKLFIMVDVHENTSFFLEDNYRYGHNKVVIV